jgi:hypothetical protein
LGSLGGRQARTVALSLSDLDGDDVGLNLAVNGVRTEASGNGIRACFGGRHQIARAAKLDFIAQWRSLTGSKISGTMQVSYNSATEPENRLSVSRLFTPICSIDQVVRRKAAYAFAAARMRV